MVLGVLTNSYVQECLKAAVVRLQGLPVSNDEWLMAKRGLLIGLLDAYRVGSKSGNEIPGLCGWGLHEAVSFAERVNLGEFDEDFSWVFTSVVRSHVWDIFK